MDGADTGGFPERRRHPPGRHDPRPACGGSARRIASPGTRRRRGGQITTPQIARGHCQVNGKYTLGTHQPGAGGIPAAARTRSPSAPDAAAIPNARPVPPPAQVHGRFRFTTFSRTKFRYSRATAINDLDPGQPVPGPDHDRDRLPRIARVAMPHAVAEQLAYQQHGVIPAWVAQAGRAHGDARPTRRRTSSQETPGSTARPWPSVEQPTVRTDRPGCQDAVRYMSVDTATRRPAVTDVDTRRDEKENGPRPRFRRHEAVFAGVAGVGFEPT